MNLDDIYFEGRESFYFDMRLSSNPYEPDSEEAEAWNEGWWDAKFDDELQQEMYEDESYYEGDNHNYGGTD